MSGERRSYSADLKQHILEQYECGVYGYGFRAVAAANNIAGGGRTIQRWYERWDGTVQSLTTAPRTGRPKVLSRIEINRHIRTFIRYKNRTHHPIHYPTVRQRIIRLTGKSPSPRTVRRYGNKICGIKLKRTISRTPVECEYRNIIYIYNLYHSIQLISY
jgi:hypothetical protein